MNPTPNPIIEILAILLALGLDALVLMLGYDFVLKPFLPALPALGYFAFVILRLNIAVLQAVVYKTVEKFPSAK